MKPKPIRAWALVRRRDGGYLHWGNYGTAHNAVSESMPIFTKKYIAVNLFNEMGDVYPKKAVIEVEIRPIQKRKKKEPIE